MKKTIATLFFTLILAASAQWACVSTKNPTNAPVCNTTALQDMLPARACTYGPINAFTNDFTYTCITAAFEAWITACPKKNFDVEGFCGGTGIFKNYHCFLLACETDADCPSNDPQPPVTPQIPCYDCCQICHEDDFCDANSGGQKVYAARGSTNCVSCAAQQPATIAPADESPAQNDTPAIKEYPIDCGHNNMLIYITVAVIAIVLVIGGAIAYKVFISRKQTRAPPSSYQQNIINANYTKLENKTTED